MQGQVFVIDTFTEQAFKGNPTAVCITPDVIDASKMLSIAAELGFPVTAFITRKGMREEICPIRYFTTITEIPACGHATLATANIVFELNKTTDAQFRTIDNIVIHASENEGIAWLQYPVYTLDAYQIPADLLKSLGLAAYKSAGLCPQLETVFLELDDPAALRGCTPDYALMKTSDARIKEVVLTSPSDDERYDFLLRSFCPWIGIDEDPVTGSVHSVLAGFWKQRSGKDMMRAYQASPRGGDVYVKAGNKYVELGGKSVLVLKGELV
jgi:PhzF family phenazine biosynthesis protein